MLALDLLRNPNTLEVKPLVAIFGDDAFLHRESLSAVIRTSLGPEADELAITRCVGDTTPLSRVLDELRTMPFLTARRVVVVEAADKFVTAHRKELESYAEKPSASGVLVLSVKLWTATTKLAKIVLKNGLEIDCKAPGDRELPKWLMQFAQNRCGSTLTVDSAGLLVELVGPEVGLLTSEVEKLTVYVGPGKTITREDVVKMVGAGRVETIWRTIDAATMGRGGEALADLERLMTSGEHPVGLLAAMTFSLRKLHHAGQLRRAKLDLESACRQAGVQAGRTAEQHTHLGPARVDRIPEMLLQADLDLKGSSTLTSEVVLERLIVELSSKRRDAKPSRGR